MSELVEKVALAMHTSEEWSQFWSNDDAMNLARAAIAAVAEWLHLEDDEYDSESTLFYAAARLKKELEQPK